MDEYKQQNKLYHITKNGYIKFGNCYAEISNEPTPLQI